VHRHCLTLPHCLEEDGGTEVVLPQGKVRPDAQIALTQGDENRNLQNQVGIEIVHLNPIMVKKITEEVARRRPEPPLMEVCEANDVTGGGFGSSSLLGTIHSGCVAFVTRRRSPSSMSRNAIF
jgi:hypothetical protein